MNQTLRERVRRQVGRESTPSAAVVDSQSVLTTEVAQEVGYDPAKLGHCGTLAEGALGSEGSTPKREALRHVLVDTLGLLLQVVVSAANVSEKAGPLLILEKIVGQFPRLVKVFADGGYEGKQLAQKVQDDHHLELEVERAQY